MKFVEKLENAEPEVIPTPEVFLEEIEAREKQMKGEQCYSSIVSALVGLDSDTEKRQ